MSVNVAGQPVFPGTEYTHEIVVEGERRALAVGLAEAMVVARAISRVTPRSTEVRVYAAFATTPYISYINDWIVR